MSINIQKRFLYLYHNIQRPCRLDRSLANDNEHIIKTYYIVVVVGTS